MDCVTAQRIKLIRRVAAIATRIAAQMPNRTGGPRHAVMDERGEARDPPIIVTLEYLEYYVTLSYWWGPSP
jgi:hypothetical protein